jgi:hypothetical protein
MWNASLIDGPIPSFQYLGADAEGQPIFGAQTSAYNLNVAASIYTDDLAPFRIEPTKPKRVFAGAIEDTIFLTFESEAEAIQALGAYWTEPN